MRVPRPTPIRIERELLERIYGEARRTYPSECCGWVSGPRGQDEATRLHPCENAQLRGHHPSQSERGEETAYVISGNDLLTLSRQLDGSSPAKLIYHSHSDGRAYFSETDQEVAASPWGDGPLYPVQQLVIGISAERVEEAALFAWCHTDSRFVEIARYAGAEI